MIDGGDCYQNALIEWLNGTLKETLFNKYNIVKELKQSIVE
ncbi:MAG: hypothetical protein ABJL44_12410 [Algibacter sp.]